MMRKYVFYPKKQKTFPLAGVGQLMQPWHLQGPAQSWLSDIPTPEIYPYLFIYLTIMCFAFILKEEKQSEKLFFSAPLFLS